MNSSWGTIERLAKGRQEWKNCVAALNAQRHIIGSIKVSPKDDSFLLLLKSS